MQSLATVAKQADIVAKSNPLEGKKEESSSSIPVNSFYHVSIDCPGYGRSSGDKQSVRSYPGQLFTEVVQALGKRFAWCLVGSSQGACAVRDTSLSVHLSISIYLYIIYIYLYLYINISFWYIRFVITTTTTTIFSMTLSTSI